MAYQKTDNNPKSVWYDRDFRHYMVDGEIKDTIRSLKFRDETKQRVRKIAEEIGVAFDSVRVDILVDDNEGGIYLNEITFIPNCGMPQAPESIDFELGSKWNLQNF